MAQGIPALVPGTEAAMRATSTFAHVAGGVLVAHGTLGFAVTGVSATPDAREALLGIGISPLVNLAHVGLGDVRVQLRDHQLGRLGGRT